MTNKFIIFIFLFTQLTCFAQDMNQGLDVLKKLETKFNKTQNIKGEVKYVTSSVNTKGLFYVKGNSFLIQSDKIEIINNNKENCIIYPEYKEITLTKNNHSIVTTFLIITICLTNIDCLAVRRSLQGNDE